MQYPHKTLDGDYPPLLRFLTPVSPSNLAWRIMTVRSREARHQRYSIVDDGQDESSAREFMGIANSMIFDVEKSSLLVTMKGIIVTADHINRIPSPS